MRSALLRAVVGGSVSAIALSLGGCGESHTLEYKLGRKGSHPTFTAGSLTLLLEGVDSPGADEPRLSGGFLLARGPGETQGKSSVDGIDLAYSYRDGVLRCELNGVPFRIAGGSHVELPGDAFPLDGPARTVVVKKDGSPRP